MMRDGPRSLHPWTPLERRPGGSHCYASDERQASFDPYAAFDCEEFRSFVASVFALGLLIGTLIALLVVMV